MTVATAPAPSRPSKARRRRKPATTTQISSIAVIAAIAAMTAAITSDASPTGTPMFDVVWRAAFVVVTTLAAARARRWSLVVGAGLVVIGAAGWWSAAGLAALALTFVLAWEDKRSRIVGAAAGALIGLAALHLGWPTSTFATALLAAVAVGVIWVSGYRTSSRRVRRRVRFTAFGFIAFVAIGLGTAVVFAVTQRSNVQQAIDEAITAADGIGGASTAASTTGFASAKVRLDTVVNAADAPWMLFAQAVPALGTNMRSIRESSAAGAEMAGAAEALSAHVNYDRLQLPGGGIDLGVLSSFREPVAAAEGALTRAETALADASSPFVVGPLASRMGELHQRVARASSDATTARLGVETVPKLLGADGPRRYLLLLGNPAEARDLGGHLGNWAEITATGGRIDVVRVGAPYELFGPNDRNRPLLPDPTSYPRSLIEMNPTRFPQNWGTTPDMATVARLAAELYPQSAGGAPIDGVIYADPEAFAAALTVTGPVSVPGTDRSIDASSAAEFLERGQYSMFATESQGDTAVTDLVDHALRSLLHDHLPSPSTVGTAFGPAVRDGHLRFFSLHDDELGLLERLHLDGAVTIPDGADALGVITRNANPSKIDAYLERKIDDHVTWNPDSGEVRTKVVVTLTNTAPATGLAKLVGLPPAGATPGTNRTELAVLSPLQATDVSIDGVPAAIGTRSDLSGLKRHTLQLDLAPGQTRSVTFDLAGRVEGGDYRLRWIGQPLANPDSATLFVRSSGAPFVGGAADGSVDLGPNGRNLTGGGGMLTLRIQR